MYKKAWCTYKVVVLRNKPIAFIDVLVAVAVFVAKAPYWYRRIYRDVIVYISDISIPEAIEDVAVYTI